MEAQQVESEVDPRISLMSKRTRYELFRAMVVKKHKLFGSPEKDIQRMVRLEIEHAQSLRNRNA